MKKPMNLIAVALCAICAQAVEFSYDVNRDGTITLRDVRGSVPADLVIPSEIDDRKVTGIGKGFCKECDSLKSVKFPESLLVIADDCFAECGKLRSVELNEGLLEIGDDFCEDCSSLTSIVIPSTVEHIAHSFCACAGESKGGITAMSVRPGNETFAVDGGILYDKKTGVVILAEVDISVARIPEGTRAIGECAFWGCRNLTLIEWPKSSSVEYIDDEAFVFCRALQSIDIPEGVREIHEEAFVGCRGLISVHLPSTLEVIASHAFGNCDALKSVTFAGGVPRIDNSDEETDARFPAGDIYVTGSEVGHYTKRIVGVVSYVLPDKGWDAIVATGTWQGCLIKFAGDDQSQSDVLESSYGPFVPGEKVSLTIPVLVGYAAKGLPSGLKLNKKTGEIAGAAKKSTGDAGVTVTFTKKNEPTLTAQFVVGPMPTIEIALAGDTEKCKVKGAGSYLVGKKVSLSATAPKGTAFVGWTANGVPWPNAEDSKKAKLSYVMTKESVSLIATFEKEKMRVACPALAAASFTVGVAGDATGIPIEIETQSGVKSVAVSKLPAGMKYDKKAGRIVGAPTKAGSFDVTIKVTAKSGAVETLVVPVKVAALPDWAVGTFVGIVRQVDYDAQGNVVLDADGRHDWYDGEMTVTVSAKGKISGKLTLPGGEKGSFSSPAYDSCGEEGCVASGNMKIGKTLKVDVELRVTARSLSGGDADFVGDVEVRMHGNEGADTLVTFTTDESRPLRQQIWKAKTLPLPPSVDKKSVVMERGGFLYTLNFGKNGAVNDVLASSDSPKKAIKKGKPVFSIVGFWDSVWHCELFGTPVVDVANGGEERVRVNVNIASDGSLSCALAE